MAKTHVRHQLNADDAMDISNSKMEFRTELQEPRHAGVVDDITSA